MIGRRAIIGLALLCALAFSAIAASGAMAETKTATAFTCVKKVEPGGAGFSKEHCSAADAVSTGATYEHVEITPNAWTAFDGTNEKTAEETKASTNAVMSATIGGLKATITAKKVTATGEMENFEDPATKVMDIKARKVVTVLTEVTLSGALKTVEGCEIKGNTITTNALEGTSIVNTMEGESKPEVGTVYATIQLEKCKTEELNKNGIQVTGTSKAIADGATGETTALSTAGLKAAGQTASLTGKLTTRMINGTTLENPIGGTTIIDP